MTTIATAVATGDHDTPLFAESRLYRQVQRIYLVPVSGVEEDKERKRERGSEDTSWMWSKPFLASSFAGILLRKHVHRLLAMEFEIPRASLRQKSARLRFKDEEKHLSLSVFLSLSPSLNSGSRPSIGMSPDRSSAIDGETE